jgi:DGQHR domain-containing protein
VIGVQSLSFPITVVREKESEFYLASLPARQLVGITYADVRRMTSEQRDVERYLGIQRPLSRDRVKQIRSYLQSPDAKFPTGIIVAVDERCASLDVDKGILTLFPYVPEDGVEDEAIPYDKIAKVLDGQHRLAGFLDDDRNWAFDFVEDRPFDLSVAVFVGADLATQAEIFATVNLAQTKVNRSLVYDLQDLAKSRSPFKTCHDVAIALDEVSTSPFFQRIKRLGVRTEGRDAETITQAAFVESLIRLISAEPLADRNALFDGLTLAEPTEEQLRKQPFRKLFIDERDLDITEIVHNYFSAVRDKWPESWKNPNVKGNIVAKSNAFKAFMRYLKDIYPRASEFKYTSIPSAEEFQRYFDHVDLKDEHFTTRTFVPGSSGQSMFYKLLSGQISSAELMEPAKT